MQKIKIGIVVLLVLMLSACAFLQPQTGLSTKQQATVWLQIYNYQYDDTMALAINPSITEDQKKIVREKKRILNQVWPLLKIYVAVVDGGGTPTTADTVAITNLINQLTALAIGGGK